MSEEHGPRHGNSPERDAVSEAARISLYNTLNDLWYRAQEDLPIEGFTVRRQEPQQGDGVQLTSTNSGNTLTLRRRIDGEGYHWIRGTVVEKIDREYGYDIATTRFSVAEDGLAGRPASRTAVGYSTGFGGAPQAFTPENAEATYDMTDPVVVRDIQSELPGAA